MPDNIDPFVHLHTHTHGSLLDGMGTFDETVREAARLGQPAIAFTDHGKLIGIYDGFKAVEAVNKEREANGDPRRMKFIPGLEAYFTPSNTKHDAGEAAFFGDGGRNDVSGKGAYTHLTLWAENNVGLRNLFQMSYLASIEGFFKKPRISLEMLAEHGEGIILSTGCPSGEVQTRLRLGQYEEAVRFTERLIEAVGKNNVYVEVMEHGMSGDLERGVQKDLLRLSAQLDLPLVATNDGHYATHDQAHSHEQLLAIQTGAYMSEKPDHEGGKRFAFEGDTYYVKSYREMAELFPEDIYPGALSNTLAIADRCTASLDFDPDLRPRVDIPAGMTEEEYLTSEAEQGLRRRLPDKADLPEYKARLKLELDVINERRFAGYFLVVSDFTRWAKKTGIMVGSGRGSAGGSMVAFATDITDLDPIKHDLLFERFLNPERDSPPDVDMDFDDTRRDEVYEYVKAKYGVDYVSQVITFGKIKGKSGIKDSARILEAPFSVSNALSAKYPPAIFGKDMPLKDIYDEHSKRYADAVDFRDEVLNQEATEVIESALKLEGRIRSTGVHACAVLISNKPLTETVPVEMRQKDGMMVAQFEYPPCESLGLLKIDFLGLRNLSIMDEALRLIKLRHNIDVDLDAIKQGDMDDPKTFQLLASGDTLGVFQLDGGAMRNLLRLMKPTLFDDISAVLALYRPGPMGVNAHTDYALRKNGLQESTPIHPELAGPLNDVLSPTYNLIVYQEQIMRIAQVIAGYSLGEADMLRRAMGKKKKSEMDKQWDRFLTGALERGYSREAIQTLWNTIEPFADYAFNKSHSVGYAYTSYLTAYLKANFRSEYMSALLSSVADDKAKTAEYLDDCRAHGLKVSAPDVNNSLANYAPLSDNEILFGLKAIKGVGEGVCEVIVNDRTKNGKYKDFTDLMNRLPSTVINKRVLESMGYGGAFDKMGYTRKSVLDNVEALLKSYQKNNKKAKQPSQIASLFDGLDDYVEELPEYKILPAEEWPVLDKLRKERDVLGLYVSAHPLDELNFGSSAANKISDLLNEVVPAIEGFAPRGKEPNYTIAGLVTAFSRRKSKKGTDFGAGVLEDKTGTMEIMFFGKTYQEFERLMNVDAPYSISGYTQKRDENISFIVSSVRPLEFGRAGNLSVRVKVTAPQWEQGEYAFMNLLRRHLTTGPNATDVIVSILNDDQTLTEQTISLGVQSSVRLLQEIREMFGAASIGRWRKAVKPPVAAEV